MKKILVSLLTVFIMVGCSEESFEPIDLSSSEVPESLEISDIMGIKVESTIVSDEIKMNVKLPYSGEYRIKIRDIGRNIVSQEKIIANAGDNILKVYTKSLNDDGYSLELTDNNNKVLGVTSIIVKNN
jgi:uncharacterized lipoprotein NlpE involved in copper resistance